MNFLDFHVLHDLHCACTYEDYLEEYVQLIFKHLQIFKGCYQHL